MIEYKMETENVIQTVTVTQYAFPNSIVRIENVFSLHSRNGNDVMQNVKNKINFAMTSGLYRFCYKNIFMCRIHLFISQ